MFEDCLTESLLQLSISPFGNKEGQINIPAGSLPLLLDQEVEFAELTHQIIVDVTYGWPIEKNPRKERVNALAKQISNHLLSVLKLGSTSISSLPPPPCHMSTTLSVVGTSTEDLQPLRNRLLTLCPESLSSDRISFFVCSSISEYLDSMTKACPQLNPHIVYLSPDAVKRLDVSKCPPRLSNLATWIAWEFKVNRL